MQILNFFKSLYFNFRYLPFRQAVYMPVWITTNFRIHGLKRGQLILHQPYRKSVFLGDCGSPGLQEMKGGLLFHEEYQTNSSWFYSYITGFRPKNGRRIFYRIRQEILLQ